MRSGSVCDDVEFLVPGTLQLPHRRMSLDGSTRSFAVLREALLGYRGTYRFVSGADTITRLWGCSDGRLIEHGVSFVVWCVSERCRHKLAYLAEFLSEFVLQRVVLASR